MASNFFFTFKLAASIPLDTDTWENASSLVRVTGTAGQLRYTEGGTKCCALILENIGQSSGRSNRSSASTETAEL